ncbi:hypothetical protein OEG92_08060 [Polaribacter sejongensis]|uniref:hypothetical protein n=1 Tax=Polaribacter sejongensis TaxID=985043 RepID=UPI0035A5ACD1
MIKEIVIRISKGSILILCLVLTNCKDSNKKLKETTVVSNIEKTLNFNLESAIADCQTQLERAVPKLTDLTKHPRFIEKEDTDWHQVPNDKLMWTSGFYPGILWYAYDVTGDNKWKKEAIKRTEVFEDFKNITEHHDIGFMMFPAYGNGFKIGDKKEYKDILLTSANSLATRFNPNVGTIKSWSNKMHPRWKQHITIIDNMLNLELLFWSAKNGGNPYIMIWL